MKDAIVRPLDARLLRRLFRENLPGRWPLYAGAAGAMALVAAMTALSAWIMRDIVNEMIVARNIDSVMIIAVAVAAIFIVKGLAGYAQGYFLSKAGNRIIAEQQRKLFDRYLEQDARFFQEASSSDLMIRITHNAQAARGVIDLIVTAFIRDSLTLAGLVTVMAVQQPVLLIGALTLAPLALLGVRTLLKRARVHMAQELSAITLIMQTVKETTAGIRVVKAFGLEPLFRARMNASVRDVEKQANRIARLEAATNPIMETLAGFAIAGMLALSGVLVVRYGQTPGELMSFITALLLAYDPAKRLARMRVSIEAGLVSVRSIFEILDRPVRLSDAADARPLADGPGAVSLKSVRFAYRDGDPILDDLTLEFAAGRMTALVGPSGGGKSTIVNLIMRLYDPDSGAVTIDGQDLRQVTLASLRRRVAYVGQEAFLFTGSVRQNIGHGREGASEAEIVAAAKAANAHDFVMALPGGYDAPVIEAGANLSGGQRQRLTIARAFLRDAPILLLDEPTSALDAESEALIRAALAALSAGRTTIVIAHRLSTVAQADRIVVIDRGAIVEQGTQAELLAKGGAYRRLYDTQFAESVRP